MLNRDLYAIRDRTARGNAAIKVLEELGYEVELRKRREPPKKPPKRHLSAVGSERPNRTD